MAELTRDQILNELLSIRAGLSLMNEYQDAIEKENSKKETLSKNASKMIASKANRELNLNNLNEKYKEEKKKQKFHRAQYTECLKKRRNRNIMLGLLAICVLGVLALIVFGFIELFNHGRFYMLYYFGAVPLLILIAVFWKKISNLNYDIATDLKRLEDLLNSHTTTLMSIDFEIQEEKRKLKENSKTNEKDLPDIEKAIKEIDTTELVIKEKAVYETLKSQYSTMLRPEDWKYIDLILYYFNSGRADTLKEALQLVDRQVQTNQILNSIQEMSNQLGKVLVSGINYLKDSMDVNYQRLSASITENMNAINTNNKLLIEQKDLQKAMMNKIDVSCYEICQNISSVTSSIDKVGYELKNGIMRIKTE